MSRFQMLLLGTSLASVLAVGLVVHSRILPLGVPGEWVWSRVDVAASPLDLALAVVGVGIYAGFVAIGMRSLQKPSRTKEAAWLVALLVASVFSQVVIQTGAPTAFGLTKWVSLAIRGSSGYFHLARSPLLEDPWRFWSEYPSWIKDQDSLHVGTHPPGLLLVSRTGLALMEASPETARWVSDVTPESVTSGFRFFVSEMPQQHRSAVTLFAALTLLICSATVVPLYMLARKSAPASIAWSVAALWPVMPSAILFQPAADTFFPMLSTSALALAAWGGRSRSALAGAVLAIGMQFTLAFLPVGLAVALVFLMQGRENGWRSVLAMIAATGFGFLLVTLVIWALSSANPFVIWSWNLRNHARFYDEYSRTYLSWFVVNPIELAIAIGLSTALLATVAIVSRKVPPAALSGLIVLALLNLSGKNLGEVARLWLPLMPTLLVAAGAGLERVQAGARFVGSLVFLVALQTILLQVLIQVVYPI